MIPRMWPCVRFPCFAAPSAPWQKRGADGLELLGVFQIDTFGFPQFVDHDAGESAKDHDVNVREPAHFPAVEKGVEIRRRAAEDRDGQRVSKTNSLCSDSGWECFG